MAEDPQIAKSQKSTIPKYALAVMEYKEPDISAIRGGIMTSILTKLVTGAVLATAIPALALAQKPPPIIDMHVHAEPVALAGSSVFCAPYEVMPVANSGAEAPAAVMEWLTKPDCDYVVTPPTDDDEQTR